MQNQKKEIVAGNVTISEKIVIDLKKRYRETELHEDNIGRDINQNVRPQ